ncbi:MAG: hypothetical protein IJU13_07330 [Bacteroidales bacterium]|nr:hypothetical protein [Bacteroidales bacterium]
MLALPLRAGIYESLEACCGEAQGGLIVRLPIHDVAPFEGIVLSEPESPNAALNPNLAYNIVNTDFSRRIAYILLPDSGRGIRLEFAKSDYNRLRRFDRVMFNLNGCKVRKDPCSGAIQVTNVMPGNILSSKTGAPLQPATRTISQLGDKDVYTLVTLDKVEFVFKEGAIVNFDERFCQYVPALHPTIKPKGYADGACTTLRDAEGYSISMAVNTLCPWRKDAVPQGSGSVTGILVYEKNIRYGDAKEKLYIRPLSRSDIKVAQGAGSASWKTWIGWFPGRIPGNNFDFEKVGNSPKGIDDRLANNVGPKAWLSIDSGERRIQKAGSFNSLLSEDGQQKGGSIKTYGTVAGWYEFDGDVVVETRSILVEFSTKKLKANKLQFCFEMAGGDGDILHQRGIPARWKVEYSLGSGAWKPLRATDGTDDFGLRPIPCEDKTETAKNRTYHLMYACGIGMQQHTYTLPDEVLDRRRVTVRITPSIPRWFHLSTNPVRDVEFPDETVNLVKPNNQTYSTVRLGSVFIDYK